jgi:hypothetical protein
LVVHQLLLERRDVPTSPHLPGHCRSACVLEGERLPDGFNALERKRLIWTPPHQGGSIETGEMSVAIHAATL